ncbi:hypothetical protein AMTRI_Chr05g71410 [Amborella trichopoda]|uniref:DUF761 domain-containing protein n=1 Tax=Amborella trichopoda TaxID=13333 RepID=W1P9Z3_AMBTC|nr:hypothetical protein AMTR_s00081p00131110 [Amborella trichopoda]
MDRNSFNISSDALAKPETSSNKGREVMAHRTDEVDENAEAFIKKFRQRLQIERLESIENYKQMLARGT